MAGPVSQAISRTLGGAMPAGGFAPQTGDLSSILAQLGVNLPQNVNLKGLGFDQAQKAIGLAKGINSLQPEQQPITGENFFDPERDPGKVADFVFKAWDIVNKMIQDRGGQPIGILEFVNRSPFSSTVKQMFSVLYDQNALNDLASGASAPGGMGGGM